MAAWLFWLMLNGGAATGSDNTARVVMAAVFAGGAVGVARRLRWGLWLACALLWVLVFGWAATVMPSTEEIGNNPIERMFSGLPPQYVIVGLIVAGTGVILGCVYVLVSNKRHFRSAWW